MHESFECINQSDVARVVPYLSWAWSITGKRTTVLRVSASGVARKSYMSKCPQLQQELHAPPAQHTTAPTSVAKCLAWKLDSILRFVVCFPRIQTTHWLEGCYIDLKCSVPCRKGSDVFRLASILGVNPLATSVISAHQNISLPKLTCYLCSSASVLFILPGTEKQR